MYAVCCILTCPPFAPPCSEAAGASRSGQELPSATPGHTLLVCSSQPVQAKNGMCVYSLGCFWGVLHPPIVPIYPPISVSEAAAPPIRVMACKADLYSLIITKQLHTCKYTAIDCTIVTLRIGAGLETGALDFSPLHPPISKFWREHKNTGMHVYSVLPTVGECVMPWCVAPLEAIQCRVWSESEGDDISRIP